MWGYCEKKRIKGNPIALCEGGVVPLALLHELNHVSNQRIIWFLDNTTALHSFVKGRAGHATLDRSVSIVKFLQARRSVGRGFREKLERASATSVFGSGSSSSSQRRTGQMGFPGPAITVRAKRWRCSRLAG